MKTYQCILRSLLTGLMFVWMVPVMAQLSSKVLDKKIVVDGPQVRFDSLLAIFSRQTGIEFSFNSKKITPSKMIKVPGGSQTLLQWLNTLKQTIGVQHKVVGDHIILADGGPVQKKAPPVKTVQSKPVQGGSIVQAKPIIKDTLMTPVTQGAMPIQSASPGEQEKQESTAPATDTISEAAAVQQTLSTNNTNPSKPAQRVDKNILESVRPIARIDVGVQGLGIGTERKLGKKITVDICAGINYIFDYNYINYRDSGSNRLNLKFEFPQLYASINPRWYYNRHKRAMQGKDLSSNAGNYVGLMARYVTDQIRYRGNARDVWFFNVHWGMQRPVGSRWIFNTHIGGGYAMSAYEFPRRKQLYPSIGLRLSYKFK